MTFTTQVSVYRNQLCLVSAITLHVQPGSAPQSEVQSVGLTYDVGVHVGVSLAWCWWKVVQKTPWILKASIWSSLTFDIRTKDEPVNRTTAQSWRFPAVLLFIIGWLDRFWMHSQRAQLCSTWRRVPMTVFEMTLLLNSSKKFSSRTMHLVNLWTEGQ